MKKKEYIQPQAEVAVLDMSTPLLNGSITVKVSDDVIGTEEPQFAPGFNFGEMTGLGEIGNLIIK